MSFDGISARAYLHFEHMKKKPCKRCGKFYDKKELKECPYCSGLSDAELQEMLLQQKIEREQAYIANRRLGLWFLLISVILAVFLLAIVVG